ncbi:hypothetical protein RND71_037009 [Anisodus tanguticus]|uniref:Uncharacterized protein n=1 Tax=Anisodus tanguticus TaxID=243964 RepID=A0AAE1V0V7_9SOLA|nr:hypothetical protein RND71_037009 [Anisodus tanguticus]
MGERCSKTFGTVSFEAEESFSKQLGDSIEEIRGSASGGDMHGLSYGFLDNKPKGFLLDETVIDDSDNFYDSDNLDASEDIGRDLDTELELLTRMNGLTMDMMSKIDRFYITLQFQLEKAMSPCII